MNPFNIIIIIYRTPHYNIDVIYRYPHFYLNSLVYCSTETYDGISMETQLKFNEIIVVRSI